MRAITALACVTICLLVACASSPSMTPNSAPLSTSTPTHVLPSATPTSTPLHRLHAKSALEEIRQRMLISDEYWHTMWIQFEVVEFPLQGSNTMRRADRLQIWLRQPAEALLLLGCMGDCDPGYFLVSDGNHTLEAELGTGVTRQGEVTATAAEYALELLLPYPVDEMIFPGALISRPGIFTVIGEETFAVIGEGNMEQRAVIVLEYQPQVESNTFERLSIDALTGMVLLRQVSSRFDGVEKLECEYSVSRLLLDPQFAPDLFKLEIPAAVFFQEGPQWTVSHGIETPVR